MLQWRGLRQGRLASLDDVDVWSTRVMVDDMDLNIHMNNRCVLLCVCVCVCVRALCVHMNDSPWDCLCSARPCFGVRASSYARLADCARYKYMARLLGSMSKLRGISVANGGVGFQFIKEVRLLDYLTFHTSLVAHDRYARVRTRCRGRHYHRTCRVTCACVPYVCACLGVVAGSIAPAAASGS